MNKKLNIICHAFPSWKGDYLKSTVELMKELAMNHNVLYIDYAYTLKDVLTRSNKDRSFSVKKIIGVSNPIEKISLDNGASLHLLALPPIIPFNWVNNRFLLNTILKLNRWLVGLRIKPTIKKLKMQDGIVINAFNPFFNSVEMKQFKQKANIYYCYDNIDASVWSGKHGYWLEKNMMHKMDAIVFTSNALQDNKKINHLPTHVINNGVNISIFERALQNQNNNVIDDEINIGYVGSIDDRLDYELLEQMVRLLPNWKFHFIGRKMTNQCDSIKNFNNIKFYGAVDANEIPLIIKNFNAGIIPFVKNDFTSNIYPMKANEYLALGLPVIMTDFAKLEDLETLVSVPSRDNFIQQLISEVTNDSILKKQMRIDFAKQNSWKEKAASLEKILYQYA